MTLWSSVRGRLRRGARGQTRGSARRQRAAARHAASRSRASEAPARYSFALRSRLLFGTLLLAALALIGRAVDLQLVDHPFLASRAMHASRALPQSSRTAATSPIAMASR